MIMGTRRAVVVLSAVMLLAGACGGDDAGDEASGGGGGNGGQESVTLTAADFKFDTETLSVASGGSIDLVNEDDAEHNLTAEDAGLDEDVDPGSSVTIALEDVEPGTYDFHCEYHPDSMTGTLEVTG